MIIMYSYSFYSKKIVNNIRCLTRRDKADTFEFAIDFSTQETELNRYQLKIHQLNHSRRLEEKQAL
jgi:hypothetical protein